MAPKAAVVVFSSSTIVLVPQRVARDAKRNTLLAIYFVTATTAKEVLNNVQKNMARSA